MWFSVFLIVKLGRNKTWLSSWEQRQHWGQVRELQNKEEILSEEKCCSYAAVLESPRHSYWKGTRLALHQSRVGSPGNLFFNHESFWLTASCFSFRYWKLEGPVEENLLCSFCSCQHFLWTTHHLSAIVSLNRGDCHGSERSEEVESVPEDRRVLHKHNYGGESK